MTSNPDLGAGMALRDASWYDRPDVHSPKVYHVVVMPMVAACDSSMPLADFTERPVADIVVGLRCQRAACRNRWHPSPNDGSVSS